MSSIEEIAKIEVTKEIQDKVLTIRGLQVMLDRDLAELYHVEICKYNNMWSKYSQGG